MINLNANYPIPTNPTWNVCDSSKFKAYTTCERMYFYRYVLGWQRDFPSHDLVFGEAWHRAMKRLFDEGFSKKTIEKAFDDFLAYYRTNFSEDSDLNYIPKSPGDALKALIEYVTQYERQDHWEVLFTERAGTVLIDEGIPLHFRLDAVVRDENDRIFVIDHKTTKWAASTWTEQFSLDFQVYAYLHVLHCMYPCNPIGGLIINGTRFFKSKIEHIRVPINKSLESLNAWFQEAQVLARKIKGDFKELSITSSAVPVLLAFPRRTTQCVQYMRMCQFADFCSVWANPLRHVGDVPEGFKIEWWNPAEKETIILAN